MTPAPAKLNLALVVGPLRGDGKHEVLSVIVPLALADEVVVEPAAGLAVEGFAADTLVRGALEALAAAADTEPRWKATIEKRIPVAAGLGGGSSDAATALRLANAMLPDPLPPDRLHALAAELGADVPFFLEPGPKLARGDGTSLQPAAVPPCEIVLLLPEGASKSSTAAVYDAFDGRDGAAGFERRAAELERALGSGDLAGLPPNDLASSPYAATLRGLGAVRADVTGAGPTVYGLFHDPDRAERAAAEVEGLGRVWLTRTGW